MTRFHTPLRYPGGKQKLAPFIVEVMEVNGLIGGEYAEPYAGGSGVAIQLLLNGRVRAVHLNDASPAVYAFWCAVLNHTEQLCRKISGASLTVEEWERQREIMLRSPEYDELDRGFSLFFLNRCNRSGIPLGGLIGGRKQTGAWKMDARFNKTELIRRVEAIAERRDNITLHNLDAEQFITEQLPSIPDHSLVYCDPPYYQRSRRLYLNDYQPADHERVAGVIQQHIRQPWMVSYDNEADIHRYYENRRAITYNLQYSAAHRYLGSEAIFFSENLCLPTGSCIASIDEALQGPGLFQ